MKIINIDNYKIILERKPLKLWMSGNSFRYMCIFHIFTSIGTNLFDITCTEGDIINILETFYDYIATSLSLENIYLNTSNIHNMNSYGFQAEMIGEGGNSTLFSILEYNPLIDFYTKKISFILSDNIHYTIEDLLIDIYEEFLSDIPDMTYINPDFLR